MKKCFFIAAALLALAACSKVTPTEEPAKLITFDVINYANSTKGNAGHLTFEGANFGAYAWVTQTDWATDGDASFFWGSDPQQITQNNDGKWTTSPLYFWPKQAKLSFASYAPFNPNCGVKPTFTKSASWAMSGYVIPDAADEDLMFADLVTDLSGNVTTAEAAEGDGGYHFTEGVPTLFHHKLTRVNFQFALAADKDDYSNLDDVYVVVNSASIVNINNTGSYANNAWTPTTATAEYAFVTSDKELKTKGSKVPADNNNLILLPQTLVASTDNAPGQQLKISYTIFSKYKGSENYLQEPILDESYDLVGATVPSWNQNMDVLYTVNIYPTEQNPIYFDPAVKAWDPETEQAIDVNKTTE